MGKKRKKIWLAVLCACFEISNALEIGWCSRTRSLLPKGLKLTLFPICGLRLIYIVLIIHILL